MVVLRGGGSRVDVASALGGKLARLELGGRQWLWTNDALTRGEPTDALASDSASYAREGDSGGWDECFPTVSACRLPQDVQRFGGLVLPDHGELWSQRAQTSRLREPAGEAALTRWAGRRMPYVFERTTRVEGNGAVELRYLVRNESDGPLPYLWSSHPLFPLTPATRLELPEGAKVRVWTHQGLELGPPGSEHRWPRVRAQDKELDLSRPGAVPGAWAMKLFVDVSESAARPLRLALAEGTSRLVIELEPREVPTVGLWINNHGWTPFEGRAPYSNLGLEPCLGAPDDLSTALGAWRAAQWLGPKETRSWKLRLAAG
jgi:galactose mutarotase-like enzyme